MYKYKCIKTILSSLIIVVMCSFDNSQLLLDQNNLPTKPLKQLLTLFNIPSNDINEIIPATQKQWIRNKERWNSCDITISNDDTFVSLMHELGCIDPILPKHTDYEAIIILGSSYQSFLQRLQLFIQLHDNGIKFKKVIILSSTRPLDRDYEIPHILQTFSIFNTHQEETVTESDMMYFVFNQMVPDIAKECIKAEYINVHMKNDIRPTTKDTIIKWLATKPVAGKYLFISNQPHITYQESVIKTHTPKDIEVEVIGSSSDNTVKTSVYLDNIARWLYQENLRRQ
jgi:hypothetical protein